MESDTEIKEKKVENSSELSRAERFGIFIVSISSFVALLVFITDVFYQKSFSDLVSWGLGATISLVLSVVLYFVATIILKMLVKKKQKKKSKTRFVIWVILMSIAINALVYIFMNSDKFVNLIDEDGEEQTLPPNEDSDSIPLVLPYTPDPEPEVRPPDEKNPQEEGQTEEGNQGNSEKDWGDFPPPKSGYVYIGNVIEKDGIKYWSSVKYPNPLKKGSVYKSDFSLGSISTDPPFSVYDDTNIDSVSHPTRENFTYSIGRKIILRENESPKRAWVVVKLN